MSWRHCCTNGKSGDTDSTLSSVICSTFVGQAILGFSRTRCGLSTNRPACTHTLTVNSRRSSRRLGKPSTPRRLCGAAEGASAPSSAYWTFLRFCLFRIAEWNSPLDGPGAPTTANTPSQDDQENRALVPAPGGGVAGLMPPKRHPQWDHTMSESWWRWCGTLHVPLRHLRGGSPYSLALGGRSFRHAYPRWPAARTVDATAEMTTGRHCISPAPLWREDAHGWHRKTAASALEACARLSQRAACRPSPPSPPPPPPPRSPPPPRLAPSPPPSRLATDRPGFASVRNLHFLVARL